MPYDGIKLLQPRFFDRVQGLGSIVAMNFGKVFPPWHINGLYFHLFFIQLHNFINCSTKKSPKVNGRTYSIPNMMKPITISHDSLRAFSKSQHWKYASIITFHNTKLVRGIFSNTFNALITQNLNESQHKNLNVTQV